MAPMRQGQTVTRRSAVKVVVSRELPRSAGARVAACSRLTVRWQRSERAHRAAAEVPAAVVAAAADGVQRVGHALGDLLLVGGDGRLRGPNLGRGQVTQVVRQPRAVALPVDDDGAVEQRPAALPELVW
jgi:hypothetical protein